MLALVAALLVAFAFGMFSLISAGQADSSAVTSNDVADSCIVPDRSVPRVTSSTNLEGYPSHQDWAANPEGRAEVTEVSEVVAEHFGAEDGTREALESGLIGITIDDASKELVVVTDPNLASSDEVEDEVVDEVEGEVIEVRTGESCNSSATLLNAWDVLDNRTWMAGLEELNIGYGINPSTSQWDVTLSPSDKDVGDRLRRILGGAVNIEYEELQLTAGSRQRDSEPHFGGAAITGTIDTDPECTSLATVVLPNGDKGSVTAGHCFKNDEKIYSGNVRYGTAKGRNGYPEMDMVRIHPSGGDNFGKKVWVDPDGIVAAWVSGSSNMSNGQFHCSSGAVSLRLCGHEVNSVNYTLCLTDKWGISGCRTGLTRSISIDLYVNGGLIVQDGDSGGPMYTHSWPEIDIRGMILGSNENGTRMFGVKINEIKNHLDVGELS